MAKRAKPALLGSVEPPRPGGRRVPRRGSKPARYRVEHEDTRPQPGRTALDQGVHAVGREVHEEALRGDEDGSVLLDGVQPARVERRRAHEPVALVRRKQRATQADHVGQVDGQPADAPVVHPPELRLEPFAQGDDRGPAVSRHEAAHRPVEAASPESLPLRERLAAPEALREGEVDPLHELDRERIVDDRVGPPRLDGAVPQRPEERPRDRIEADADAGHRLRP